IGGGTVSSGKDKAELTVTGAEEWKGKLNFYLCGPIAAGSTCDNHGVLVTSKAVTSTESNPFESATASLTSVGHYCCFGEFVSETSGVPNGTDNGAAECFDVAPKTPTLTTAASCTNTATGAVVSTSECMLGVDTLKDTAKLVGTATQPGTNGGTEPG